MQPGDKQRFLYNKVSFLLSEYKTLETDKKLKIIPLLMYYIEKLKCSRLFNLELLNFLQLPNLVFWLCSIEIHINCLYSSL